MYRGKKLADYVGHNEKTKVIVKLQKQGQGAPGREPVISEEERKQMMLHAYRRQEELKVWDETLVFVVLWLYVLLQNECHVCSLCFLIKWHSPWQWNNLVHVEKHFKFSCKCAMCAPWVTQQMCKWNWNSSYLCCSIATLTHIVVSWDSAS